MACDRPYRRACLLCGVLAKAEDPVAIQLSLLTRHFVWAGCTAGWHVCCCLRCWCCLCTAIARCKHDACRWCQRRAAGPKVDWRHRSRSLEAGSGFGATVAIPHPVLRPRQRCRHGLVRNDSAGGAVCGLRTLRRCGGTRRLDFGLYAMLTE